MNATSTGKTCKGKYHLVETVTEDCLSPGTPSYEVVQLERECDAEKKYLKDSDFFFGISINTE